METEIKDQLLIAKLHVPIQKIGHPKIVNGSVCVFTSLDASKENAITCLQEKIDTLEGLRIKYEAMREFNAKLSGDFERGRYLLAVESLEEIDALMIIFKQQIENWEKHITYDRKPISDSNESWISVEQEPDDKQLVIIDNSQPITSPARYDKYRKQFSRYPNHTEGDRAMSYFYTDVKYWRPFPKPNTI